jgi:hypothetical protein
MEPVEYEVRREWEVFEGWEILLENSIERRVDDDRRTDQSEIDSAVETVF